MVKMRIALFWRSALRASATCRVVSSAILMARFDCRCAVSVLLSWNSYNTLLTPKEGYVHDWLTKFWDSFARS